MTARHRLDFLQEETLANITANLIIGKIRDVFY